MRKFPVFYGFIAAVVISFISLNGCRNCDVAKTEQNVQRCSEFNNKETLCKKAFQKDGAMCEFDSITKNCQVKLSSGPLSCDKMTMDQCLGSKDCTYQEAMGKCVATDPGLVGRCEIIQSEAACNKDPLCQWGGMACKDKAEFELP